MNYYHQNISSFWNSLHLGMEMIDEEIDLAVCHFLYETMMKSQIISLLSRCSVFYACPLTHFINFSPLRASAVSISKNHATRAGSVFKIQRSDH